MKVPTTFFMRKIYFNNLAEKQWNIALYILAVVFIIVGYFEIIAFQNPRINKNLIFAGFVMQVIPKISMFWYKNYVEWNKKGIVIRVKSFLGKSIQFSQVQRIDLHEKILHITKFEGKDINIDLGEINDQDANKLFEIFHHNIS